MLSRKKSREKYIIKKRKIYIFQVHNTIFKIEIYELSKKVNMLVEMYDATMINFYFRSVLYDLEFVSKIPKKSQENKTKFY